MSSPDFVITDATRVAQSVSLGLFGPSGCGKTLSALRVAKGIQSVVGGSIYVIDTEARRALDYADDFKFKHVDFVPPFGSDRYLAAIETCRSDGPEGPRTIIVDSFSHEHESEGGMLEQFEAELQRLAGDDYAKREKNNARAWIKPKAKRRSLIVRMDQMRDVNFILTFRAADSTKPGKDSEGKNAYIHMGFMPIGGRDFVFGTKATVFLPAGSDGVPLWNPEFVGEKLMRKLPYYLKDAIDDGKPLSEEHGRRIAEWARGKSADEVIIERVAKVHEQIKNASNLDALLTTRNRAQKLLDTLKEKQPEMHDKLTLAFDGKRGDLEEAKRQAAQNA